MIEQNMLLDMETFFLALADKTRLRLLNLMREDEVCVCFFTEILGDSQPKISRHLAYLRSAGIVEARREGKWMHYSISKPRDEGGRKVLQSVLDWLDSKEDLQKDRENYKHACCSPEMLVRIARTPMNFISAHADMFEAKSQSDNIPAHNELEEFLL